jgi:uncharacterized phage protein (TIGR01671 family)
MRKLKFRAWDKKEKKWICVGFHIIGEVTVFDMLGNRKLEDFNDIEITQFTGLLDKHGKEIYEGDIVEGFGGEKYKVVWEDNWSRFVFENFDEEDYSYDPADNENCSQHYLEVIGNIYENSDLLSDDKKGENK